MAHVDGIRGPSLAAYFVGVDIPLGIATQIMRADVLFVREGGKGIS